MRCFSSNIYRSNEGRRLIHDLYRMHLVAIKVPIREQVVETSFGFTHVVSYGNPAGKPVLCFYNHMMINPLAMAPLVHGLDLEKLFLIVPDPIGQIGFSEEKKLSFAKNEYGAWAAQLLSGLGLSETTLLASSFGSSIALQLCLSFPSQVNRLLLLMPAGLSSFSSSRLSRLMKLSGKEDALLTDELLIKALDPLIPFEQNELKEMYRLVLQHVKLRSFSLSQVKKSELAKLNIPTGVIADRSDYFFPGEQILKNAQKHLSYLEMSDLIDMGGHYGFFNEACDKESCFALLSDFLLRDESPSLNQC